MMSAVRIPAAKVLAPDSNILSFDIRPKNIPRLNIIPIMRTTETTAAVPAGIRSADAKKKGSIEITAAINGDMASTRAVQNDAKRDAFPCIVLPRSVNIALFNLLSRLFLSALSAIYAPEKPETPIAKLAPNPMPMITLGLTAPEAHAPTITPSMVIAPSKEFITKYLLEMLSAPVTLR